MQRITAEEERGGRMPLVSLGLPVYNGERYLEATFEALRSQEFQDFEVIVSDNASEDGTGDLCKRYAAEDARIRYFRNQANIGAAPNFNLTFERARGRYFKWVSHDDLLEPGFLGACVEVLERDPGVVLVHSEVDWIDAEGHFLCAYDPDLDDVASPRAPVRFRNLVESRHWCIDVFGLIRRDVLARTPLIASYIGSDRNLLAELALYGRYQRIPEVLFHSRDHTDRSIRALNMRERGGWFDPTLRDCITLPFWRSLCEYARSIRRAPLRAGERLACYAALPVGFWVTRRALWVDLKVAAKQLLLRTQRG